MTDERGISRRTFIKGAGATAGVAAVGMGSSRLEAGPVQEAEAIAPLVFAAAAIGASAVVGWGLREYEVIGSDSPAIGLTPDALENRAYEIARTRESTNASTFVDNMNILNNVKNAAYADAKVAAIEALNAEKTEADVLAAGVANVDDYETTVKKNQLKTWNESAREFESLVTAVNNHSTVTAGDVFDIPQYTLSGTIETYTASLVSVDHTLPDGSSFEVMDLDLDVTLEGTVTEFRFIWSPLGITSDSTGSSDYVEGDAYVQVGTSAGVVDYLIRSEWESLYNSTTQVFGSVRTGLETWVSNVYSQVQAGELDTADLLTPRELSEMTTDDETFNQAIADLMALNISVNLEREAEIRLPDIGATLFGSIAVTGDTTLSPGTIDPAADSLNYYFTYNVAEGEGTWDAHQAGVDGGTVTFTKEPFPSTLYLLETTAGETVEFTESGFVDNGDGTWTIDLSADLETSITDISSLTYYAESTETDYQTVQLTSPFEIVTFRDSEGTEVESADYTSNEPQDDTNYITAEEWKAQEERYLELIDKYEESQSGGGAGFAGMLEGDGGLAALAVLALAAFGIINR